MRTRLTPVIFKLAEIIADYDFEHKPRDPLEAEAYQLIVMARMKLIEARAKLETADVRKSA